MSQWFTLLQKELLEMTRNFKWIWVPISFILIGVMDPLSTYYLPQILNTIGDLPEGAVIDIPTPPAPEVLMMSLANYNLLGILIIILTTMGLISGERKSGVAGMILVKPVSYFSFVTAKWTGAVLLILVSFFLGYLSSWYYVGILFDWVPFINFIQSFSLFGLYLIFVISIVVFFNSLFIAPGIVGFVSIATVIIMNIVSSNLSHLFEWSPGQLMTFTVELLNTQKLTDDTLGAIILTLTLIVALLVSSITIFKRKELA